MALKWKTSMLKELEVFRRETECIPDHTTLFTKRSSQDKFRSHSAHLHEQVSGTVAIACHNIRAQEGVEL